jgi:hypothetical protein
MTGSKQNGCEVFTRICRAWLSIDSNFEGRATLDASLQAEFIGCHRDIVPDSGNWGYM